MTMIDTLYDGHYKSREKLAWEFAKILNQEARELEAAGVDIIQFDEPAFNVFFDEVNDWGIATLERAIEGLKPTPTGSRRWARSGASTRNRSRSCRRPAWTSSRWNATTRTYRST
ncbi:hypothetical protein G6F50_015271 [Rhizopus delemar]|uniref:Cobalamin-independent methionine synthase MetE C-terminal/archaeal domain-containing protein n=1 Tax=Rhizopus delemar TaxID=936053 RepID=A0A9P6XYV4_9FUNG|nr:hypothetical protein G6F50_015271 [Rhizopus delemar]